MSYEECFDSVESCASQTYPTSVGSVRLNSHVILKGFPCKIVEIDCSKTGKHGHAKATMVGIDIFTGKKYEDSFPTSHKIDVPELKRTDYILMGIDQDGFCSLIDEKGNQKEDLRLPTDEDSEEMVERLRRDHASEKQLKISVMYAMGKEKIISYREDL